MEPRVVKTALYDKSEKATTTMYVEQLAECKFRMIDNDIFNDQLAKRAEFETIINNGSQHEIIKITKPSKFITKRFFLSPHYKESEYRMLGDEIVKRGGFWQVDFGGIATVNIPKNLGTELDQLLKEMGL